MVYTVFDTETTGLSPYKGDRVIELAALKIIDGKISQETFVTLINPERNIPYAASSVNGITDAMVKDAPVMFDVLPYFMEFIGDSVIVAHNAKFDMRFLESEIKLCGLDNKLPQSICTVEMSRKLFPYQRYHNLDVVTKRIGVKISDRHRALGDVIATAEVFLRFIEQEKLVRK